MPRVLGHKNDFFVRLYPFAAVFTAHGLIVTSLLNETWHARPIITIRGTRFVKLA
jgi:hypothetical protein